MQVRRIAEVFVCRDARFLILQRAGGRGRGWWMPPGGDIEDGEQAEAAAIRETFEETGLRVERPQFVRRYTWRHHADSYAREINVYFALTHETEVTLGAEHTAFAWTTPEDYIERFCSERLEQLAPDYAGMFREYRATCADIAARLRGSPHRGAL